MCSACDEGFILSSDEKHCIPKVAQMNMACKPGHFDTRVRDYTGKTLTDVVWSCNKCMIEFTAEEETHMIG